jgi:hypothetical protein
MRTTLFVVFALLFMSMSPLLSSAQTENVIYSFTGASDGYSPFGNLLPDGRGNYYGVAALGGGFSGKCQFFGCGTVFELSPNSSGGWTQTVIYTFRGGSDGATPESTLTFDSSGNLYGTAVDGGYFGNSSCQLVIAGCGVVFKLSPNGDGTWSESVIHSFHGADDGFLPETSVVFDASGNLYGTTSLGGTHFVGNVFQLSPNGSGGWSFRVVYAFTNGSDGGRPDDLIIDASGNLFASTSQAGITGGACTSSGCGTIIELSPNGSGGFTRRIVHDFTAKQDGAIPFGISLDANGNLFGAALFGGHANCSIGLIQGCGVIFEFTQSGGHWQAHNIYSFTGGTDGADPYAAPTFDSAGNIYGTSDPPARSCPSNCGSVFKLSPTSSGWSFTTLYNFPGGASGVGPYFNGITIDAAGNLLGMTQLGGSSNCNPGSFGGCGLIYEITP